MTEASTDFPDTITLADLRCAIVIDSQGVVVPTEIIEKYLPITHAWLAAHNRKHYYTTLSSVMHYLGEQRVEHLCVYVLNRVTLPHNGTLLGPELKMFPVPSKKIGYCKVRARWSEMFLARFTDSDHGTCTLYRFRSNR